MNIAIIGYGKMGKEIEKLAKLNEVNVKSIIDSNNPEAEYTEINKESLSEVDVAIDFTHPDCVIENIRKVSELGVNLVIGTTGWYDSIDEVKEMIEKNNTGALWSGNFSIGVNLFFRMIRDSAKVMNKFKDYDSFVHEFHHKEKADSPSGTAIMIGNILLDNLDSKEKIATEELKRKIEPNELHVSSSRGGYIPGTHIVGFDSLCDTIELKHTARGRMGFASGALSAAKWINEKKGFFNIDDMMKDIIGN